MAIKAIILITAMTACAQVDRSGDQERANDAVVTDTISDHGDLFKGEEIILTDFRQRRVMFDDHLKSTSKGNGTFTCPSCGYPTLSERGGYEICAVCNWEDDGQDDKDADKVRGGPNHVTLTQSRLLIGRRLLDLQDSLHGTLITDPDTIATILQSHRQVMDKLGDELSNKNSDDPRWQDWEKQVEQLKRDLINKKD